MSVERKLSNSRFELEILHFELTVLCIEYFILNDNKERDYYKLFKRICAQLEKVQKAERKVASILLLMPVNF